MKTEVRGSPQVSLPTATELFNARHGSSLVVLKGGVGSLDGACTEKLLLHCAAAIESNDVTLAQQVMWVLNNVAAAAGDPNQRLASWFLRALLARASRVYPHATAFRGAAPAAVVTTSTIPMSITELAAHVDLLPWHRFGFSTANGAICQAVQGCSAVHILDLSVTHCMQWPTLIDELAKRPEGAPSLRITVPDVRPPVAPLLNVSIDEIGVRLANFAQSRKVPFGFHVLRSRCHAEVGNIGDTQEDPLLCPFQFFSDVLDPSLLDIRDDETLVINCQNWLRYLPDEGGVLRTSRNLLTKDGFLGRMRALKPAIFTVVDEDADLDSPSLSSRIKACFNYLWIPFDALETFLPKDSRQRAEQEAAVGLKIENIVGFEGHQRIERAESGSRVARRMKRAGFCELPIGEETLKEVKSLLDEHAGGWGMKKEDEMLVLTWKGHNSVFVSVWSPAGFSRVN